MFKDILKAFFKPTPEQLEEYDFEANDLVRFTLSDIELKYFEDDFLVSEIIYNSEYKIFSFDIDKRYKAILRRMLEFLYGNICNVKFHAYSLTVTISLLFGLSSSQSSTLFSAFFGTSLSRIPSI